MRARAWSRTTRAEGGRLGEQIARSGDFPIFVIRIGLVETAEKGREIGSPMGSIGRSVFDRGASSPGDAIDPITPERLGGRGPIGQLDRLNARVDRHRPPFPSQRRSDGRVDVAVSRGWPRGMRDAPADERAPRDAQRLSLASARRRARRRASLGLGNLSCACLAREEKKTRAMRHPPPALSRADPASDPHTPLSPTRAGRPSRGASTSPRAWPARPSPAPTRRTFGDGAREKARLSPSDSLGARRKPVPGVRAA